MLRLVMGGLVFPEDVHVVLKTKIVNPLERTWACVSVGNSILPRGNCPSWEAKVGALNFKDVFLNDQTCHWQSISSGEIVDRATFLTVEFFLEPLLVGVEFPLFVCS